MRPDQPGMQMQTAETQQTLQDLREFRGLSRTQLAAQLNTSESTIHRWEHARQKPNAKHVAHLASVLRVPVHVVIDLVLTEDEKLEVAQA